jgi:hypothetical protein
MIADSVLNVCKYFHNSNPQKSNNAFSDVTQIVRNGFLNVIEVENRKTYQYMYISENAMCSHPSYQKAQRDLNRDLEKYQEWRSRIRIGRPKRSLNKPKRETHPGKRTSIGIPFSLSVRGSRFTANMSVSTQRLRKRLLQGIRHLRNAG